MHPIENDSGRARACYNSSPCVPLSVTFGIVGWGVGSLGFYEELKNPVDAPALYLARHVDARCGLLDPADLPMCDQSLNWRSVFPQLAQSRDPWLSTLLDQAQPARLPAGSLVFRHGLPCQGFVLLLSGSVSVTMVTEKGSQVALYRVLPGETCMLTVSCLMSGEPYPAQGMTESETTALMLDTRQYQEALDRSREFRGFVLGGLGHRLAGLMRRIDEVAYGDIDELLAAALLRAAGDADRARLTHQALAVEIGTAREVVSRHLKRFENSGWIRMQRGSIELLDSEALSRLARTALCD